MIRETHTIKTSSGKEAILKSWITAREKRDLNEITLKHVKFGMETEAGPKGLSQKPVMKEYDAAAAMRELDEATIRVMVVSFDGSEEDIVNRLLDCPEADWGEILTAVKAIVENPTVPK